MNFIKMLFKSDNHVCPAAHAGTLDTRLRRLVHKPEVILHDHVREGSVVMDIGCGPGYFSIPMAKMIGDKGKVIAVDLQKEMLHKLKMKAEKMNLNDRFVFHNCTVDDIGISEKVDFVLTFWMVHEVQNIDIFFQQLIRTMKPGSVYMLVEPKLHVPLERYKEIVNAAAKAGLRPSANLKVRLSRGVVFKI
jgi:ubiquinone/menaquinone biosynthesis C-methylase UbiE